LLTCSGEFKHRETVAVDTAARRATSSNVGTELFVIIFPIQDSIHFQSDNDFHDSIHSTPRA
jgi:hypothetical protein